jgi:hypothetical protein
MRVAWVALAVGVFAMAGCESDGGSGSDTSGEGGGGPLTPDWRVVAEDWEPGALLSGWASGPDDVWVVGGESGSAVVMHYDGAAWTAHDPGFSEQVWWVHGFAGGPVWVVGDRGSIARYAGGTWETLDSGAPGTTLYGIWGATPDDLWAVGGPSTELPLAEQEGDVVLRYDGSTWSRVTVAALQNKPTSAGKNLFKVWGASADRAFIVGDSGLALHWDGASWDKVDTGVPGVPLFTVTGRSATDVWATGGFGASVVLHWDGATWTSVPLPPEAPDIIQGIWTAPGEPLYTAGWYGYTGALDAKGDWHVSETDTSLAYHAIFGDGQGHLWAVGGNIYSKLTDYKGICINTDPAVGALPAAP